MKKRIVALLMAMVMLLAMIPMTAFAAAAEEGICYARDILNDGVVTSQDQLNGATDTSVDYLSVLGITQVTAEAFGEAVRNALLDFSMEVDVSSFGVKVNHNDATQKNAFCALLENEVFYSYDTFMYDGGTYSWNFRSADYLVTKMTFYADSYKYTKKEFYGYLNLADAMMDALLVDIKDNDSLNDLQKALLVHDRLAEVCEYDYDDFLKDPNNLPKESYTAFGVLWRGVAVCQGYAETYGRLLDLLGIKNRYAQSSQINHIWNIVTINGAEYYVDVTWDDPAWDRYGQVEHSNFLVSYDQLKTDHIATDFVRIPPNATYDNAFWRESHTAFQLIDGDDVYFLDTEGNTNDSAILYKWTAAMDGTALFHINSDLEWRYAGNYTCLSQKQGRLYFNTAKKVWQYDPTSGDAMVIYTPSLSDSSQRIYGFTVFNERFLLNINSAWVNSQSTMTASRYQYTPKSISTLEIYTLPRKITFVQGAPSFACAGLSLKATYTDGTSEIYHRGYGLNGWGTSNLGSKTVTATYGSFRPAFNIEIVSESQAACKHTTTYEDVQAATLNLDGKVTIRCQDCGEALDETTVYRPDSFSLSSTCFNYDGQPKTPVVVVKDRTGNALLQDVDYTVTYPVNREEVGKYTVTVTLIGKYSGVKKLEFTILNPGEEAPCEHRYTYDDIQAATLTADGKVIERCWECGEPLGETVVYRPSGFSLSKTAYTYDGKTKSPAVTVKDREGNLLVKDEDYTVSYSSDRKNVGTYTVTITFQEKYSGTKKLTFKINKLSISKASVKMEKSKYYYSKNGVKARVTIKVNGVTVPQSSLKYTYKNNKKVGTATVTATVKGNFSGSKKLSFKIYPKVTSTSVSLYEGTSQKFSASSSAKIQYRISNSKIFKFSNGKIRALKPGTATLKVTSNGLTTTVKVTVKKIQMNKTSVTAYSGYAFTLKVNGGTGKYTWSSSNSKIAKISSGGKVTPLKCGTCYIYAKKGGKTYKCKVTVSKYRKGTNVPDFGALIGKLPVESEYIDGFYVDVYSDFATKYIEKYLDELEKAGFEYYTSASSGGVTYIYFRKGNRLVQLSANQGLFYVVIKD